MQPPGPSRPERRSQAGPERGRDWIRDRGVEAGAEGRRRPGADPEAETSLPVGLDGSNERFVGVERDERARGGGAEAALEGRAPAVGRGPGARQPELESGDRDG